MSDIPTTPAVIVTRQPPRVVLWTRFLSWLTAVLLATAVIISLVSVTNERNALRNELQDQNEELFCRSTAAVAVNAASVQKQIAVANHSVLIGEFVRTLINSSVEGTPLDVDTLQDLSEQIAIADEALAVAGKNLAESVEAQERALATCGDH